MRSSIRLISHSYVYCDITINTFWSLLVDNISEGTIHLLPFGRRLLYPSAPYVKEAGVDIKLDQGSAFELPYPDNSFDRVVSSLVIHHLTHENKVCTFREIFRALKPDGEMHIADFGKPQNVLMYLIARFFGLFEDTSDNIKGLLPQMFREAGFEYVEETTRYATMFGTLSLYRARKSR
jgi:ubiquinone/menaquinone biosynthesis C-methylase UbiE